MSPGMGNTGVGVGVGVMVGVSVGVGAWGIGYRDIARYQSTRREQDDLQIVDVDVAIVVAVGQRRKASGGDRIVS